MTCHRRGRGRYVLFALVALVIVLLGWRIRDKVVHERSAFRRWRPQILQIEQGVDISARHNYPHPPIMAVLLEPLERMPPLAGALVWFTLKVAMAVLSLIWVFRLVESDGSPFPAWAKVLVVLFSLKPIIDDLTHGNVNLFILFLMMAALTAYRQRRDLLAGGVLALAIACKITPGLFIPYLLWKRSWRAWPGAVSDWCCSSIPASCRECGWDLPRTIVSSPAGITAW